MLHLNNITFAYNREPVLKGLSLQLPAGQIHGIVGLNGAGKTTLMQLITGGLQAQDGSLHWQGQPMNRHQVAYLETSPYFYPRITGMEYLKLFQVRNPAFDVAGWNQLFGLPLGTLVNDYSSGMRKKLALMGVLAYEVPLYLLDEPFNNLDIETNAIVARILGRLTAQGKTILLTSHILEALTTLCHSIAYLYEGRMAHHYQQGQYDALQQAIATTVEGRAGHLIDQLVPATTQTAT